MTQSTTPSAELMKSINDHSWGTSNPAFDHEETPPTSTRQSTPTEIFCVTPHGSSGTTTIVREHISIDINQGSPKQLAKVHGGNLRKEIANEGRGVLYSTGCDNLDVSCKSGNQSVCTLSEIEIPSPVQGQRGSPNHLNNWLQEQNSSEEVFDTHVTSFNEGNEPVCMQVAGPSGTSTINSSNGRPDDIPRQYTDDTGEKSKRSTRPPPTKRTDSSMSVCSSVLSDGRSCRICWTGEGKEALIQPCKCSGSSANVHVSCLKKWLQVTNQFKCEVCKEEYATSKTLKPISKWTWRCSKTRPLSQLEAILILLGIVTPPLLCGIVLCSQKVAEYLPHPQDAWKTATLLILVIASTLMYIAALIYFCLKLSTVCNQWLQTNQRTVVRLGSVEAVIENTPSVIEAREDEREETFDHDLFAIWTLS